MAPTARDSPPTSSATSIMRAQLGLLALVAAGPTHAQASLSVQTPVSGETVADTVTVRGTFIGSIQPDATVEIAIDDDAYQAVQGIEDWDFVWDSTTVADGPHTIHVRAHECATCPEVTTDVDVIVENVDPGTGIQVFTVNSSVDGTPLTVKAYIPTTFDPLGPEVPLVVHLHGAGGLGRLSVPIQAELEARGWIGIAPDGRAWGLTGAMCDWPTASAYMDSPDPEVGPGEQDILDIIAQMKVDYPIDEDRLYLAGFSMGGRGSYMLGLKRPDMFAAIAPMGAIADTFEWAVHFGAPGNCYDRITSGAPGSSALADTLHYVSSGRFLIENAYNLPVYPAHGLLDPVVSNDDTLTGLDYMHGWHMTGDSSFDQCHNGVDLCFGHTPTLAELAAHHPGGYDWAYMFSPVAHTEDPLWISGTPVTPGIFGTEDPENPGMLLGIFDFFERRTRVHNPETVVFKTYEDQHRSAYWVDVLTAAPWQATPAAVRATRVISSNRLKVELARVDTVTFDLERAGLTLDAATPLTMTLATLQDAVYDPALDTTGEDLTPIVRLIGGSNVVGATVLLDGTILDPAFVTVENGAISIGPLDVIGDHELEVHAAEIYCSGGTNTAAGIASIAQGGTASMARNDLTLVGTGATPDEFGMFFHGFSELNAAWVDGFLCVGGTLFRSGVPALFDATGNGAYAIDLTAAPAGIGPGTIAVGDTIRFQYWYRDAGGPAGSNTSDAMRVTFLP